MFHLLIFGASGVSGWAVAQQALQYPSKDAFARVTGLTNRPLDRKEAGFSNDDRLQLVSGIDLTSSVADVANGIKTKVSDASSITSVIFVAYIQKADYDSLREVNVALFRTAVQAVEQVALNLKSVVLQTGGKGYGLEFPDKVQISPPLKESSPRIPKPYYDSIFYYPQTDAGLELSQGKSWSFNEVRPDVIIGFTPGSNAMNATQGLGIYLSLWKEVHGAGSRVPFIGTTLSWTNTHTDTFQDILAKQEIYLTLNQDKVGHGDAFNAADGEVTTWEKKWPAICSYFGLVGQGPASEPANFEKFASTHSAVWKKLESEHGLKEDIFESYNWPFLSAITTPFNFDREYDLGSIRNAGFAETIPTIDGYTTSFDRMRTAKIIP